MKTATDDSCIDTCNSLLRGELSAVETYTQAIEKIETVATRLELERIREEHRESARKLHNHVLSMGAKPAESSGAWGLFAQGVEGGAKLFGENAALAALRQGEEHGVSGYRAALDEEGVMEEIKTTIRAELLPRLQDHVVQLSRLTVA